MNLYRLTIDGMTIKPYVVAENPDVAEKRLKDALFTIYNDRLEIINIELLAKEAKDSSGMDYVYGLKTLVLSDNINVLKKSDN